MAWLIWLGVAVGLLLIEFITVDMIAIWFAAASLVMVVVTAIFPDMFWVWQFCIFLAIAALLVLSTRKFVKKFMKHKKNQETNLELVINHTGRVVEKIDNDLEVGAVKINGVVWSARSENGEPIAADELITVLEIKGNKLIVVKKSNSKESIT